MFGDDEIWCVHDSLLVCPTECKCFSQSIVCKNLNLVKIYENYIWISVKFFTCFRCTFDVHLNIFSTFQTVMFLNIKDFMFTSICLNKDKFDNLFSLNHLDISLNRLTTLNQFCFFPLQDLTIFYLQHNLISSIADNSFYSLPHLNLLDLSHNKIEKLKRNIFNGLSNIKLLNLKFNLIIYVPANTFRQIPPNTIHSLNVKVRCMSNPWINCQVKEDAFSNCHDLLSITSMKYLFWVIAILVLFLNTISFVLHNIKMKNIQKNILPLNYLIFVDGMFGIYLMIIASADMFFKGNFVGYELLWKNNIMCKISSVIALIPMMLSPIVLCIMVFARYCVIQWPMTSTFK